MNSFCHEFFLFDILLLFSSASKDSKKDEKGKIHMCKCIENNKEHVYGIHIN